MKTLLVYLLEVNTALAFFYLLYIIFLKRNTFFRLRRIFFLSVIIFSLAYPMFTIPALASVWTFDLLGSHGTKEVSFLIGELSPGIVMTDASNDAPPVSWKTIVWIFYWCMVVLFALRFVLQLFSIFRFKIKSKKQSIFNISVYCTKEKITPFSFLGMIFIHPDQHNEEELWQILVHEQTHVRQMHSFDVLLAELICFFSWWNPFAWLLKREMTINMEYLADHAVLSKGINSREYQYHLLRLTYHDTAVQIVNNFNVSQLKQRIMMMNTEKSSTLDMVKYLLVFPLFFLFVMGNSIYAAQHEDNNTKESLLNEVLPDISISKSETISFSEPPPVKKEEDEEEPLMVVDVAPVYPGGMNALVAYLSENIKYPEEAHQKGIEGRVICRFVVTKDGSIDNVEIMRGVDPDLDAEAIRVVKMMPLWEPGMNKGEAVNVYFTLPVVFRLNKENLDLKEEERNSISNASKEQAAFPGGESALVKYLVDNIKYPVIAQENGIQGHVAVEFRVDSKGKPSFVRISKGIDPSLDKEVKRIIDNMPDWIPAKNNGQPVDWLKTLDFVFRLQGENVKTNNEVYPENAIIVVGYAAK